MQLLPKSPIELFAACQKFFGIEGWYKYVPKSGNCQLDFEKNGLGNIWLILAGITDILMRVGIVVMIVMFIIGAFKMVMSQGSPEGVKSARNTMTNALIGFVLLLLGAWIISFLVYNVLKP
ncbi:MAG: pilin [Candidatus Saccharimonadales bacterium]